MAHWGSCSPVTRTRWVRPLRSNYGLECSKEWGAVYILKQAGLCIEPHLCMTQNQWSAVHLALFRGGRLYWFSLEEKLVRPAIMGGEPVTTAPSVLIVDEDVRNILKEAGLLSFFKKFLGHSESITKQFIESWKDGRVVVSGTEITVNEALIADVSGLPNEGKGKVPLHQGLMKLIVEFALNRKKSVAGPSKGGFARVSGSPISKAQLLLGPILASPPSGDSATDSEGDSKSLERTRPPKNPKEKSSRKTKLTTQILSANLAKCSRRSTRLQKKSEGISSLLDISESSEEDRKSEDPESLGGRSSPPKVSVVAPSVKSEKSPTDSLSLSEELRCHLWVLNRLGGSLTSTCACINLLTLEITNYLKEVLKNMKEMKDIKE
eukprot:Gb_21957 [translate_table: standard]